MSSEGSEATRAVLVESVKIHDNRDLELESLSVPLPDIYWRLEHVSWLNELLIIDVVLVMFGVEILKRRRTRSASLGATVTLSQLHGPIILSERLTVLGEQLIAAGCRPGKD